MFTLRKSDKKVSSRQQINIKGVRDGVLLLPSNQYRIVLEVSSLNFELKSEDEQDALIDTYESFLNSLPCPLQIVVRIRELDMTKYTIEKLLLGLSTVMNRPKSNFFWVYLADLKTRHAEEKEKVYRDQLINYSEFVHGLVEDNRILARKFYVVLPYGAKDDDFVAAKERLTLNADLVAKGLNRMGMQTRVLGSLEILDLFHSFYNPAQAKRQPLTESVARLLNSSYTRKGQL